MDFFRSIGEEGSVSAHPVENLQICFCEKKFRSKYSSLPLGPMFHVSFNCLKLTTLNLPKGHSAMDKALVCNAGGRGSNLDTAKDLSAPILTGTPEM